jgi:hypothetical protein
MVESVTANVCWAKLIIRLSVSSDISKHKSQQHFENSKQRELQKNARV